jgi:hypothetical protein
VVISKVVSFAMPVTQQNEWLYKILRTPSTESQSYPHAP